MFPSGRSSPYVRAIDVGRSGARTCVACSWMRSAISPSGDASQRQLQSTARLSKSHAIHHSVTPVGAVESGIAGPRLSGRSPAVTAQAKVNVLELEQPDVQADPVFWCEACTLKRLEED
jgi:hypothetical protein